MLGRNGVGKSTLLRFLAGLRKPRQGNVYIGEHDVLGMRPEQRAKCISFVESGRRMQIPGMKVSDIVALGRAPYTDWIGRITAADEKIVNQAISIVGLTGMEHREYDSLSDGEAQRVNVARALAQQTPFMLLDEPSSFLDLPSRYELCITLRRLVREQNIGVIFSIHDLEMAMQFADQCYIIEGEKFMSGTPDELVQQGVFNKMFDSDRLFFDKDSKRLILR